MYDKNRFVFVFKNTLLTTLLITISSWNISKGCQPNELRKLTDIEYSHQRILNWKASDYFQHPENPFLKRIPKNAALHPHSKQMIKLIKEACGARGTNTYIVAGKYGRAVWFAKPDAKKFIQLNLTFTQLSIFYSQT